MEVRGKLESVSSHLPSLFGSQGSNSVLRLGSKHLYLMSHLAGLRKREFSSTGLRTHDIEHAGSQERKLANGLPPRDPEKRPG